MNALGISLLMFVLLGPVVQPWYLTWGIILMAPVVTGRMLTLVLGLSVVAPFIGLTGGASLLHQLVLTNPASMVAAVVVLWGVAMFPLGQVDHLMAHDRHLPGDSEPPAGLEPTLQSGLDASGLTSSGLTYRTRWSSTTSSH